MKTPREILLAHHRAAEPKLDDVRQAVVSELNNQATKKRSLLDGLIAWFLGCSNNVWRELVWPCRWIWSGLAAAWVVILAVNFSIQGKSELVAEKSPTPTPEMIMAWRQQERLLAELIGPNEPRAATPPKPFSPRPSSERPFEILMT